MRFIVTSSRHGYGDPAPSSSRSARTGALRLPRQIRAEVSIAGAAGQQSGSAPVNIGLTLCRQPAEARSTTAAIENIPKSPPPKQQRLPLPWAQPVLARPRRHQLSA